MVNANMMMDEEIGSESHNKQSSLSVLKVTALSGVKNLKDPKIIVK